MCGRSAGSQGVAELIDVHAEGGGAESSKDYGRVLGALRSLDP